MWEKTSVIWYKQLSPSVKKCKGVKQGCPLSPRLFTLVLDSVLQTLAEELGIELTFQDKIEFPIILAYADDLIIVSRTKDQLGSILLKLFELLETIGLKCNTGKSFLVVRDPLQLFGNIGSLMDFGTFHLKISTDVRYLGEYFLYYCNF